MTHIQREPTGDKLVEHCLHSDGVARGALLRGIINRRALAREMIDAHALDVEESTLVRALRSYASNEFANRASTTDDLIGRAYVNCRARRSSFTVKNTVAVQERLPALLKSVDHSRGETIRILSFDGGFKIIVDEAKAATAIEALGGPLVDSRKDGLVEMTVVLPQDVSRVQGILAALSGALALRGVSIQEGWTCDARQVLFVAEEDLMQAYDAISALIITARRAGLRSSGRSS